MKTEELGFKDQVNINANGKVLAKETDFSGNIISVLMGFPLKDGKIFRVNVPPELIKKISAE